MPISTTALTSTFRLRKPSFDSGLRKLRCLVHNHPSGDPTPSGADIDMTREVVRVAGALGLSVHDHLIVGRDGVESLKARGLM